MINLKRVLECCNVLQLSKICSREKICIGVVIFENKCIIIKSNLSDTYFKSKIIKEGEINIAEQKEDLVNFIEKLLSDGYNIDLYK